MSNPNLTPSRIDALNAVDLRLFGVWHGMRSEGEEKLVDITDSDYASALSAVRSLDSARGDQLAVEFQAFKWTEDATSLANFVPDIPDSPLEEVPLELQSSIANSLEEARSHIQVGGIMYAAAHAILRGVPVYMADNSPEEWRILNDELQATVPDSYHEETQLYFRNNKMLARLGDIAIKMVGQQTFSATRQSGEKPILLFLSGFTHTERLSSRLGLSAVQFTTNLTSSLIEELSEYNKRI